MPVRILISLLLAAAVAFAGGADDAAKGSVRGVVVSTTGEPLRKVQVTLRRSATPAAPGGASMVNAPVLARTTDATGAFFFESLEPGAYQLSAARAGYVNEQVLAVRQGRPRMVTVEAGGAVTGLQIRLMPQGVIAGQVTDEDGDPVMHASVQVVRAHWLNGRPNLLPLTADSTDDRGEYRIAGLVPGRYLLQVNAGVGGAIDQAPRSPDMTGDPIYTPVFYPGVAEYTQAAPINVTPGQELRGIDFRLRKVTTWRVRGRVLDDAGKPAQFLSVMAIPVDGGVLGVRAMGPVRLPDGSFEVSGLAPGTYTLLVNRSTPQEGRTTARVQVQVGNRDVENVVIQLQKVFDVSGFVRLPAEAKWHAGLRVQVEPLETGVPFFGSMGEVRQDGTWTLQGLSPGRYRLALSGLPAGFYLQSVLAGGVDVTAGAQINAAAAGIELVTSGGAGQAIISVLNADQQPVANARVLIAPDARDHFWLFRNTYTDAAGQAKFADVQPGSYRVIALPEGMEEGDWFDPAFLASQQSRMVGLKVEQGGKEQASIVAQ